MYSYLGPLILHDYVLALRALRNVINLLESGTLPSFKEVSYTGINLNATHREPLHSLTVT